MFRFYMVTKMTLLKIILNLLSRSQIFTCSTALLLLNSRLLIITPIDVHVIVGGFFFPKSFHCTVPYEKETQEREGLSWCVILKVMKTGLQHPCRTSALKYIFSCRQIIS